MFVYWALFLIFAAGALLSRGTEGSARSGLLFLVLGMLPTLLIVGLRWKIGPDWQAYSEIYHFVALYSVTDAVGHGDPGFYLLNWTLQQVHAPFQWLVFISAAIFVGGLGSFCFRQPNPWIALLLAFPYLVIVVGMSGIRQSTAIGFLFFAFNAYEKHHPVRCMALIVIGALFHASALLMAPLCALSLSRNRLQTSVLLVLVLFVGWLLFFKSFGVYATRYKNEAIQSAGIWYRLAMNAVPATIFLARRHAFGLGQQQQALWRNLSIVTLLLVPLALVLPSNTSVDRFALYLFPLQFFVLSRIEKILPEGRADIVTTKISLIAYAALIQIVFLQFGTFSYLYLPYRSIFSN